MVTKNDYKILSLLYQQNCTNKIKSITLNSIKDHTQLSEKKIRDSLNYFKQNGYINEGLKQGSSKTYYITTNGKNEMLELFKNS